MNATDTTPPSDQLTSNAIVYLLVTTDKPEDNSGEGTSIVIPIVVTSTVVILLAGIFITCVWLYRRKTGQWPKLLRRSRSSANRHTTERHENGHPRINTHMADYREPAMYDNKSFLSTSGNISENLSEAEREINCKHHTTAPCSTSFSNDFVSIQNEQTKQSSSFKQKSLTGTVCLKNTVPDNLNKHVGAKQKIVTLGGISPRCSSFTTPDSMKYATDPSLQKLRRHSSCKIAIKNNCGSASSKKKYKTVDKNAESLFHSKRKPYHIGCEAASPRKKNWKNQQSSLNSQPHVLEGTSVLQEFAVATKKQYRFKKDNKQLGHALPTDAVSFAVLRSELSQDKIIFNLKRNQSKIDHNLCDDRTESQQSTMRPEIFQEFIDGKISEEEASGFEGQSSDTESMADSNYSVDVENVKTTLSKRRRYCSEGEFKPFGSVGRKPIRSRKQCKRTCSAGRLPVPMVGNSRKYKRNRKHRQRYHQQNLELNVSKSTKIHHIFHSLPKKEINNESEFLNTVKSHHYCKEEIDTSHEPMGMTFCQSASLKSPLGGTVLEMPIYSQATWSGPELKGQKVIKHRPKIWEQRPHSENISKPRRPHLRKNNKRNTKPDRTLSIGGDGRYFCEYGSLPVDLSKLPKSLIAKLGGRPDKLLEPIDQLNFEQLCRPLPALGKTERETSARRLMAEKLDLPPDHRDREILSNTYEYEDTGLVMTDL